MDTKINNGQYEIDSGGKPYLIGGFDEILQRVRICLGVQKGSFVYAPDFGNEFFTLSRTTDLLKERADMLVKEAVINLTGVEASVTSSELQADKSILLNVSVTYKKQTGEVQVIIHG
ncbi:MAG: hypothetical protein Q8876_00130 [Bacillota bacterium]|nr:hypothetical protein [Bacillota bacterium]